MSEADLTIAAASAALRTGTLTASDLLESVLARAAQTEAEVHAYLTIDADRARTAAAQSDARFAAGEPLGPLDGIPIALKDNLCTRGLETTCSSQILAGYHPPYDATVVARLKEGGAVVTGKTNLDEFAMGSSTENSAYGPTRNPWNPTRVPGGSSGGSAAAVAVGSALGALGSDTGGSIRQPASLCGVVGVKPTYGLVSRYGLIAFGSSLDQIGPFTRTVADAASVLEVISGHDPFDATSWRGDYPATSSLLQAGVAGMRIGVIREMGGDGYEAEVTAANGAMLDALSDAGADIFEISIPTCDVALSTYYLIAPAEASANLARFDGIRYGLRVPGATAEEMMAGTRAEGFGPEVTRRILLGTYALSAGYYDAFYGQAQKIRTLVKREFAAAYEKVDALVSPSSPTVAFELEAKTSDPLAMYLSDVCNIPANLAGHPAMTIPIGLDSEGLPIGFQVMAPALGEATMFRVGAEIERLAGFESRPVMTDGVA